MLYSFGGRKLPQTVRWARALVYVEASLQIISGLFLAIVAAVLGNAVSIGSTELSGGATLALAAGYVAIGVVLVYLGVELTRLTEWARLTLLPFQLFLGAVFILRADGQIFSIALGIGLPAAVIALLWSAQAKEAFQSPRSASAAPGETIPVPPAPATTPGPIDPSAPPVEANETSEPTG